MAFHGFSQTKGAASGLSGAVRGVPQRPFSDINVTPLVDVMLVLLVIFMVTAPMLSRTIGLDLPQTAAAHPDESPRSVLLEVDAQGAVYVDRQALESGALLARLQQEARVSPATELQLKADQRVPHGRVVELIGLAQQAGLSRIGFVAEAPAVPGLKAP